MKSKNPKKKIIEMICYMNRVNTNMILKDVEQKGLLVTVFLQSKLQ